MTKKKEIEQQEPQEDESPAIFLRKVDVIVCNDEAEQKPDEDNK